jgi:hypothetical protein
VRGSGRHSQACTPILKAIIRDEQFIKAGCALDNDVLELHDLWNGRLEAKSRLDLGGIDGNIKNNQRRGLKTLAKYILGVHLPKPKAQALSDWSHVPLTEHQISYSARDAWAGAAIASKLAEYDPETWGHFHLVELLKKQETPISQLADRMGQHKRAKQDLGTLLKPYHKPRYPSQKNFLTGYNRESRNCEMSSKTPSHSNDHWCFKPIILVLTWIPTCYTTAS